MSAPETPSDSDPRVRASAVDGLIFSGATLQEGVDAAVAELQALQPQCAPALG